MLIKDKDFFKAIYVFLLINQMLVEIFENLSRLFERFEVLLNQERINLSLISIQWYDSYCMHDYIIQQLYAIILVDWNKFLFIRFTSLHFTGILKFYRVYWWKYRWTIE